MSSSGSSRLLLECRCAFAGCDETFVPRFPRQIYHAAACREANAKAERRRRARTLAKARPSGRDEIASVDLEASTPPLLAVLCDVEREALERSQAVGLEQLHATLQGVVGAHDAGDLIALRGELVALSAQAAHLAASLPRPVRRRVGRLAKGAAA